MTRTLGVVSISGLLVLAACLNFRAGTEAAPSAPETAAIAQTGGPIRIVVLADFYGAGQQSMFDRTVANLFDRGLFVDPDYAGHVAKFDLIKVFQPSAGTSNYGFKVSVTTACGISWIESGPLGTTTAELLESAAGLHNPVHVVIVGNLGFDFGCTLDKDWTYIAAGAVGEGVLAHEFGHLLAELFDEYALNAHTGESYPHQLDCRNCSTKPVPHWGSAAAGFANEAPCDYYPLGVVHPSKKCKMGLTMREPFCPVCRGIVDNAFEYYEDPDNWDPGNAICPTPEVEAVNSAPAPPRNLRINGAGFFVQPPPQTQSIVRILVSIERKGGVATVRRVTETKGRFIPSERRLGSMAYEVLDNGKLLAVGVLQGDPFQVRTYRDGAPHGTAQADTASVIVQIPNETRQRLLLPGRSVEITFYRLLPSVTAPRITQQVWQGLKAKNAVQRLSTLSPDELRKAM